MARIDVSWTAECENCSHKLGEEHMDDRCPDSNEFDTSKCRVCDEEVCGSCGDIAAEIHTDCEEEEEEIGEND